MTSMESFSKFSLLDLSLGAGQLLYTAACTAYASDMSYFGGVPAVYGQMGAVKRIGGHVVKVISNEAVAEIVDKRIVIFDFKYKWRKFNPFTHIFVDFRDRPGWWIQNIIKNINSSHSVRFLIINMGEIEMVTNGFENFVFRGNCRSKARDFKGELITVTYFMYERKDRYYTLQKMTSDMHVKTALHNSSLKRYQWWH